MSRLFNDYASIGRDKVEGNLNSVNFPELHAGIQILPSSAETTSNKDRSNSVKASLLSLGEYEREASRITLSALIDEIQTTGTTSGAGRADRAVGYMRDMSLATAKTTTVCKGLELFASVTELYADMYVARDLTNKVK
jgi:hypothetical protein